MAALAGSLKRKRKSAKERSIGDYATTSPTAESATRSSIVRSTFDRLLHAQGEAAGDSPVIPLPDEDELERVRRRRNARRGGGRASTILSEDERMGG